VEPTVLVAERMGIVADLASNSGEQDLPGSEGGCAVHSVQQGESDFDAVGFPQVLVGRSISCSRNPIHGPPRAGQCSEQVTEPVFSVAEVTHQSNRVHASVVGDSEKPLDYIARPTRVSGAQNPIHPLSAHLTFQSFRLIDTRNRPDRDHGKAMLNAGPSASE
jgi:hypothetical protein